MCPNLYYQVKDEITFYNTYKSDDQVTLRKYKKLFIINYIALFSERWRFYVEM